MIWPSFGDRWPSKVLTAMEPGRTMIHVGEIGGCTADSRFAKMARGKDFEIVDTMSIPTWPSMGDELTILRRR
jgi:hypothetical protein